MEAAQLVKTEPNPRIPGFGPGDTVRVNFRIREGERERVQAFQGVVIRLQNGSGPGANFTVRRITAGIGIERIFPLHSAPHRFAGGYETGFGAPRQALLPPWTAGPCGQNQGKDPAAAAARTGRGKLVTGNHVTSGRSIRSCPSLPYLLLNPRVRLSA